MVGEKRKREEAGLVVALVGGGNSTHCLAPLIASVGHKCHILTRRPEDWSEEVGFENDDLGWLRVPRMVCRPDLITSNAAEALGDADIIIIAGIPIHHNPAMLRLMKPHINSTKKVFIGIVCAYGGFDWIARKELGDQLDYSLFGTTLIPWCCGTLEYGKTGAIFGAKRFLRIATETGNDPDGIKELLAPILRQKLIDVDFLAANLWPNNSSLHPPILYGLFKDWDGKSPFDPADKTKVPEFIYKDLQPSSGDALCQMDRELVSIVKALSGQYPNNPHLQLDFHLRECVLENYEDQVADRSTTQLTVRTNSAFGKHKIPYKEVDGGIVPVIEHKFFETDLPFGLVMFKDIALMLNLETPLIDDMIVWNQRLIGKEFMVDGKLCGKHIDEAIVPSRMGFTLATLSKNV